MVVSELKSLVAGPAASSATRSGDFQGTPVMNYADVEVPYTRIHEFRHFAALSMVENKLAPYFEEGAEIQSGGVAD
jgi:UDP-galactopyranose mutase